MDNFLNDLGGERPKTPIEEAWHIEQERKKYDIIRVKNPTNQDFYVMYDLNQHQKIPANSTVDIPRYIATRYITHMKDNIVNVTVKQMHDRDMAERKEKGMTTFKSKWEENEETYLTAEYPKTNDPTVMEKIIGDLWIGLVYEFGRDIPPSDIDPRSGEVDLTPPEMKILEGLEKRRVAPEDRPTEVFSNNAIPVQNPPTVESFIPTVVNTLPSPFASLNQRLDPSEVTNE